MQHDPPKLCSSAVAQISKPLHSPRARHKKCVKVNVCVLGRRQCLAAGVALVWPVLVWLTGQARGVRQTYSAAAAAAAATFLQC
jgi:hypothetical protein